MGTFKMKLFESILLFATCTGNPVEGASENLIPLLQLQDDCTANCYEIEVVTSKDPKSGTDDKIEIQMEGQNGTVTEWFQLNSPSWFYNDFETDLKTTYYAQFESTAELGIIEHIGLRKNGWNDWKVKEIIVDDETHEHGHLFEINQWIKGDEDYFFESVASTHEINDNVEKKKTPPKKKKKKKKKS